MNFTLQIGRVKSVHRLPVKHWVKCCYFIHPNGCYTNDLCNLQIDNRHPMIIINPPITDDKKQTPCEPNHQKTAIATLCLQFCISLILMKNYAHGQKKSYPVHGLYRYPPTMLLLGKVQQRNWCRLLVVLWIVWQNLLHLNPQFYVLSITFSLYLTDEKKRAQETET